MCEMRSCLGPHQAGKGSGEVGMWGRGRVADDGFSLVSLPLTPLLCAVHGEGKRSGIEEVLVRAEEGKGG